LYLGPATLHIGTSLADEATITYDANNDLQIESDGDVVLQGSSGNVGIGTSTPNNTIQVANLINFDNSAFSTALGYQALNSNSGLRNTGVGYQALFSNTTGRDNVSLGSYALASNDSGYYNTALGSYSLRNHVSGYDNIAVGSFALYKHASGERNVAIGPEALYWNVTGDRNIAIGYYAGFDETSSDTLYIDNRDRGGLTQGREMALLYGIFADATEDQELHVNGDFYVSGRIDLEPHANNFGLNLPTYAGVPSAVTGTVEGDIVWDSASDDLYVYDGSSFVKISGATGDATADSLWTDAGDYTYLTATNDDIVIGASSTSNAPFWFDVSSNDLTIGDQGSENAEITMYDSSGASGDIEYASDTWTYTGGSIKHVQSATEDFYIDASTDSRSGVWPAALKVNSVADGITGGNLINGVFSELTSTNSSVPTAFTYLSRINDYSGTAGQLTGYGVAANSSVGVNIQGSTDGRGLWTWMTHEGSGPLYGVYNQLVLW
jgi:hypothetical protein